MYTAQFGLVLAALIKTVLYISPRCYMAWEKTSVFTPYSAYRKSCDFQIYTHVQVQETPLPSMSMEAEVLLNRMGLSFSYSNELWIRLTRYWKQFLLYHQRQAEADGADTSSLEAATSQVGWSLQCNTAG